MRSRSLARGACVLLLAGCAEGNFTLEPVEKPAPAGTGTTPPGTKPPVVTPDPPGLQVVNAGSLKAAAVPSVAPLEIATALRMTGSDLGPTPGIAADMSPTTLGGVQVLIENEADPKLHALAPLLYVAKDQVNFVFPDSFDPIDADPRVPLTGPMTVRITYQGKTNTQTGVALDHVAPGIFTANGSGAGPAAAKTSLAHGDGTSDPEVPVAKLDDATKVWSVAPIDLGAPSDTLSLTLLATGTRGQTDLSMVSVTLGGTKVAVTSVQPQPVLGLDAVKLVVPRTFVGLGEVDVVLTAVGLGGERSSNAVRIAFK